MVLPSSWSMTRGEDVDVPSGEMKEGGVHE